MKFKRIIFGEKLNGLLIKRKADLSGILNGIDVEIYNPENDPSFNAELSRQIHSR